MWSNIEFFFLGGGQKVKKRFIPILNYFASFFISLLRDSFSCLSFTEVERNSKIKVNLRYFTLK